MDPDFRLSGVKSFNKVVRDLVDSKARLQQVKQNKFYPQPGDEIVVDAVPALLLAADSHLDEAIKTLDQVYKHWETYAARTDPEEAEEAAAGPNFDEIEELLASIDVDEPRPNKRDRPPPDNVGGFVDNVH